MLVDDERTSLTLMKETLHAIGFTKIVEYSDPNEALERIHRGDVDIIIADLHMPGMTGLELFNASQQLGREIPFIIVSGDSTKSNVIRAIEAGVCNYIVKPVNRDSLISSVIHAASIAVPQ